ncbi:hypothetical protein PCE1_000706 [Barthelona sp. PCE]
MTGKLIGMQPGDDFISVDEHVRIKDGLMLVNSCVIDFETKTLLTGYPTCKKDGDGGITVWTSTCISRLQNRVFLNIRPYQQEEVMLAMSAGDTIYRIGSRLFYNGEEVDRYSNREILSASIVGDTAFILIQAEDLMLSVRHMSEGLPEKYLVSHVFCDTRRATFTLHCNPFSSDMFLVEVMYTISREKEMHLVRFAKETESFVFEPLSVTYFDKYDPFFIGPRTMIWGDIVNVNGNVLYDNCSFIDMDLDLWDISLPERMWMRHSNELCILEGMKLHDLQIFVFVFEVMENKVEFVRKEQISLLQIESDDWYINKMI